MKNAQGGDGQDPVAAAEASAVQLALASAGATWGRLEDQLNWYDNKSSRNQVAYRRLKLAELIIAAALPVVAGLDLGSVLLGFLGMTVVVLAGAEHLFQFQSNWITYRSTAEALKHERYLYLAQAGPYGAQDRNKVLAEKLEGLISQEHAKWTESRQRAPDPAVIPNAPQTEG